MEKINCYDCKYRRSVPGDTHSQCIHPKSGNENMQGPVGLIDCLTGNRVVHGLIDLQITAETHGINRGWFIWPFNFDPIWLKTCNGFEDLESNDK